MRSLPLPHRALSLVAAFGFSLSACLSLVAAADEGETSDDSATTVKTSLAEALPGKWRAKMEFDDEKIKKEPALAALAEGMREVFAKMSLSLEFKADGTCTVTMEGAGPELGGEQTQKGKWKITKEAEKKLNVEFFDSDNPKKMELTFDGPDCFTMLPEDDLGPLKPPVFNRVKEKDEKEKTTRKPKE